MNQVDATSITNIVVNLIGVTIAMIGVVAGFYKFIFGKMEKDKKEVTDKLDLHREDVSNKVGRYYERLDEAKILLAKKIEDNHELVHRDFVLKEVHALEKKHQEEKVDTKFENTLRLMEIQFTQLKDAINSLKKEPPNGHS